MKGLVARATLIGVLLGVVYALSPLTVLFAAAMAVVFYYSARGSSERERRWILGTLAIGVGLRVALAVTLFLLEDPRRRWLNNLIGDSIYNTQRALWLRNVAVGVPIHPEDFGRAFDGYGWTAYHYLLSTLQIIFGPAPVGLHLVNIVVFLVAAVLLYRLVRRSYGPVPALGVLIGLMCWPTLVIWSAATLKESIYFGLLVVTVVATVTLVRRPGWGRRLLLGVIILLAAATLPTIRFAAYVPALAVVSVGAIFWLTRTRLGRVVVCALILGGVAWAWPERGRAEAQLVRLVRFTAFKHIGHVTTQGYSYKLLDDQFYADFDRVGRMSFDEGFRFVGRALAAFVAQPIPWRAQSPAILMFAPQQIFWYVVVALVPFGIIYAMRYDVLLTLVLLVLIAVEVAAVSLPSGNIGTLVRHRDMVVPFILCFASAGAVAVLGYARD